jgi:hypothetical protein
VGPRSAWTLRRMLGGARVDDEGGGPKWKATSGSSMSGWICTVAGA